MKWLFNGWRGVMDENGVEICECQVVEEALQIVRDHNRAEAFEAMRVAIPLLDGFLTDLATSNPGYLSKLVLQDYARFNEAMIALSKAQAALALVEHTKEGE